MKRLIEAYAAMAAARLRNEPVRLNFAVTYSCPGRCINCNIWQKYGEWPELKGEELGTDEVLEFARNVSVPWVSLTGGEPFTRGDLRNIALAFSPDILSITTSGFAPGKIEQAVEGIVEAGGLTFVNVSLDGPHAVHRQLRGTGMEKPLETLRRLDQMSRQHPNLKASFEFTACRGNEGKLGELHGLLESEGLGHLIPHSTTTLVHGGGIYGTNPGGRAEVENSLRLSLSRTPRGPRGLIKRAFLRGALRRMERGASGGCGAGRRSIFVDPYGNVKPCIMITENVGNLRDAGYEPGVDAGALEGALESCPGCWTPCERYHELMFQPMRLLKALR